MIDCPVLSGFYLGKIQFNPVLYDGSRTILTFNVSGLHQELGRQKKDFSFIVRDKK